MMGTPMTLPKGVNFLYHSLPERFMKDFVNRGLTPNTDAPRPEVLS